MRPLTIVFALLGIAFLIVAFVYVTTEPRSLPGFFPGYDALLTARHTKHAIASVLLALGCFVLAWFSTGPRSARP